MTMNDVAAVLRELAKDVRKEIGGEVITFSVHDDGNVFICALGADKKFDSYKDTPAGIVMVNAYTKPCGGIPSLVNPPF